MAAYRNGLPGAILKHTATPVVYADAGTVEWVEGEPSSSGLVPIDGEPFECILFMPQGGGQDNPYRPRVIKTPQILFNPLRPDRSVVVVNHEDELLIFAPELAPWTGLETARWLANGNAQPFGPPGQVIGLLATLRAVDD